MKILGCPMWSLFCTFRQPCSPLHCANLGSPPSESEPVPRKGVRKLIYFTQGHEGLMHNFTQTSCVFRQVQKASGPRKEALPQELWYGWWRILQRWRMSSYGPNFIASPHLFHILLRLGPLLKRREGLEELDQHILVVLLGTCSGE